MIFNTTIQVTKLLKYQTLQFYKALYQTSWILSYFWYSDLPAKQAELFNLSGEKSF